MTQIRLLYYIFVNGKTEKYISRSKKCIPIIVDEFVTNPNRLTFIDQHHLDDCIQRNVHRMRAHAIGATVRRSIVAVAELLGRNVVHLRQHRRWRRYITNFVDQRNQMITARRDQIPVVRVRLEQFLRAIEVETEWQKDFDIGPLRQDAFVALLGIFQIANTHCVRSLTIADCVQRIQHLNLYDAGDCVVK